MGRVTVNAPPTEPPPPLDPRVAQGRRNVVLAASLIGFVVLVFLITLVRLKTSSLDGGV
jgi:hypothetical protein